MVRSKQKRSTERGAVLAEYVLTVCLLALALVPTVSQLTGSINGTVNDVGLAISGSSNRPSVNHGVSSSGGGSTSTIGPGDMEPTMTPDGRPLSAVTTPNP